MVIQNNYQDSTTLAYFIHYSHETKIFVALICNARAFSVVNLLRKAEIGALRKLPDKLQG